MLRQFITTARDSFRRHVAIPAWTTLTLSAGLVGCSTSRMATTPQNAKSYYASAIYNKDNQKIADVIDYPAAHVIKYSDDTLKNGEVIKGQVVIVTGNLPTYTHSAAEVIGSAGVAVGNVFGGLGLLLQGQAAKDGKMGTQITENNASNGGVIATQGSTATGQTKTDTKTTITNTGSGAINTGSGNAAGNNGLAQGGQSSSFSPGTGSTSGSVSTVLSPTIAHPLPGAVTSPTTVLSNTKITNTGSGAINTGAGNAAGNNGLAQGGESSSFSPGTGSTSGPVSTTIPVIVPSNTTIRRSVINPAMNNSNVIPFKPTVLPNGNKTPAVNKANAAPVDSLQKAPAVKTVKGDVDALLTFPKKPVRPGAVPPAANGQDMACRAA